MSKKKITFTAEWHLYSITAFGFAVIFFVYTSFKNPNALGLTLALIAHFTAPFFSSNNWKDLPANFHKTLFYSSLGFVIAWALVIMSINKLIPRFKKG